MPLDDVIKERLHLLQTYTVEELAPPPNPEVLTVLTAFGALVARYRPPEGIVREHEVPDPHGEIPVRTYHPPEDQRSANWARVTARRRLKPVRRCLDLITETVARGGL